MGILSKQVLSGTGTDWNKLGDPIPAAGYYGRTSGLHTMAFTLRNFVGRIYVLATLENTIADADKNNGWFPIHIGGNDNSPWIEFPPVYAPGTGLYGVQTSGTFCEAFFGNFMYIRAGMDRDYLKDSSKSEITPADKQSVGSLESILVSY